jgi:hypothetical protein
MSTQGVPVDRICVSGRRASGIASWAVNRREAAATDESDKAAKRIDASGPPRIVQAHEGEKAPDLRLIGHQLADQAPKPDRLAAQLLAYKAIALAGRIALVEDQVDDTQHPTQPLGQPSSGGTRSGTCALAILRFPRTIRLAHRRVCDEKRACDLDCRQATERPQRQGDPGLPCRALGDST